MNSEIGLAGRWPSTSTSLDDDDSCIISITVGSVRLCVACSTFEIRNFRPLADRGVTTKFAWRQALCDGDKVSAAAAFEKRSRLKRFCALRRYGLYSSERL